jgi:hypothetical protein
METYAVTVIIAGRDKGRWVVESESLTAAIAQVLDNIAFTKGDEVRIHVRQEKR